MSWHPSNVLSSFLLLTLTLAGSRVPAQSFLQETDSYISTLLAGFTQHVERFGTESDQVPTIQISIQL